MSSSGFGDDRHLREELRRAERHPDRKGHVRKDAFKLLLSLAHSSNVAHKKLVTEKVKEFFVDFPELQDEAINVVYDLCEDQDQTVRIAGYVAITSVSRLDKNWLLRNADVLVQLLQSDDDREVTVVKRALQEHVDLDARRTLQVLCDQCIFDPLEVSDEEERLLRTRLRGLVVCFLAEKFRVCVARAVKDEEVEGILINGLIGALPRATSEERKIIIQDIIVNLPSLAPTAKAATRGQVLDKIIAAIRSELQADISTPTGPDLKLTLGRTLPLMSLAVTLITSSIDTSRSAADSESALHPQSALRTAWTCDPFRLQQFYIQLLSRQGPLAGNNLARKVVAGPGVDFVSFVCHSYERSMKPGDVYREQTNIYSPFFVDISPQLLEALYEYLSTAPQLYRYVLHPIRVILKAVYQHLHNVKNSPPPWLQQLTLLDPLLKALSSASLSPLARSLEVREFSEQATAAAEDLDVLLSEVRDITRKLQDNLKTSSTNGTNGTTQVQARNIVRSSSGTSVGKRRFQEHGPHANGSGTTTLVSRLDPSSSSNSSQEISVRGAAAQSSSGSQQSRTADDLMDVDECSHALSASASTPSLLSRVFSSYDDSSPRARKRRRERGGAGDDIEVDPAAVSRSDVGERSAPGETPSLLSRLQSSFTPAPVPTRNASGQGFTSQIPSLSIKGASSGIGTDSVLTRGDASSNAFASNSPTLPINVNARRPAFNSSVSTTFPSRGRRPQQAVASVMTGIFEGPSTFTALTDARSNLGAGKRQRGQTDESSLGSNTKSSISLSSLNGDSDEIKIRGAAQRGNDDGDNGGPKLSLLARMGNGGGGVGMSGKGNASGGMGALSGLYAEGGRKRN